MAIPRKELIDETEPGVYHVTMRCVRRAFLCGKDSYSAKDYDYRRVWIKERMRFLTGIFAIDLFSYSLMSNHMHQVLRNRPDLVEHWSDEEVAERWLRVVSTHSNTRRQRVNADDIAAICSCPGRVRVLRKRLSSISWYMGKLNEYISRRANREEELSGRFWEGRFKSSRLGDEAAIVACMAYVDLNPVRAKMADSIASSHHTSVQDRLVAEQGRKRVREYNRQKRQGECLTERQEALLARARAQAKGASFLLSLDGSDSPLCYVSERSYLELTDWTGRQIRDGKRGAIPDHITPVLQALEVNTKRWVKTVEKYGSLFHRLVARADVMLEAAKARGLKCFHGISACRDFYLPELPNA